MRYINKIVFVLLLVLYSDFCFSQNNEVQSVSSTIDKIEKIQIPPLSIFLESIYEHPSVRIFETYTREQKAQLTNDRLQWLNYLKIVGNYQYGKNSLFVTDFNNSGSIVTGDNMPIIKL